MHNRNRQKGGDISSFLLLLLPPFAVDVILRDKECVTEPPFLPVRNIRLPSETEKDGTA